MLSFLIWIKPYHAVGLMQLFLAFTLQKATWLDTTSGLVYQNITGSRTGVLMQMQSCSEAWLLGVPKQRHITLHLSSKAMARA